jgi:tetratricopeptide (TPR) repeat protein
VETYSRQRALGLLKVTEGRLRYWERRGLARPSQSYSLGELSQLRRLARLTGQGLKLSGLLLQVLDRRWVGCSQGRAVVRDAHGVRELESGQGLFDFASPPQVCPLREADPVTLLKEGQAARALERLQQDLQRQPWSIVVRFNLAVALERLERLEEAQQELGRALDLCPGHADSHYNRARLLEMLGRGGEARVHWLSFLRLEPDSPWAQGVRQFLQEQRGLRLVPCP